MPRAAADVHGDISYGNVPLASSESDGKSFFGALNASKDIRGQIPTEDLRPQHRSLLGRFPHNFYREPNAIIPAVTAANVDLTNSDGLKLAREIDPLRGLAFAPLDCDGARPPCVLAELPARCKAVLAQIHTPASVGVNVGEIGKVLLAKVIAE
ncbi:hypothetical protein AYL99_11624 [Fonsecaea erecta]|uniref:Uncharacterized protein n=1 Tax=Fonsecaea erecta TaxID=1367422 RepID=A0A178Z2R0_9EURO|nr:hypothetical protein AYL99_11624 [Fonsecaea erecta]OAP54089.1 hypothetical protein AYL99_11624 [Fonsecaea erecta]